MGGKIGRRRSPLTSEVGYCVSLRLRDPVSAERLACGATIAISGESTPVGFLNPEQMFQTNLCVFLVQACVFRWCGGIQTTSTTEEVSCFPVFFLSQISFLLEWIIVNTGLHSVDELIHTFLHYPGSRRVAVFCLLQIGSEVFDTQMMVVDRLVTDICFDGTSILFVTVLINRKLCVTLHIGYAPL